MNIEYYMKFEPYHCIDYAELKPTGRWKLESGPSYENKLFIEHKGFIFKSWISEDEIVLRPKRESHIFECEG